MSEHGPQQPMDALRQQQRVESRMIRDLDSVDAAAAAAVIKAVCAFKLRTNISDAFIARSIGIGAATLSEVLHSRYGGNWQQVIYDLDRWLEDEAKREQAPRPTEFVSTRVAQDVMTIASAAAALKTIALIYGPSGIGKTIALRAVAAEKPGSVMISIETASATMAGLVRELVRALRVCPRTRWQSTADMKDLIKEKLRGTPRLLILDEAHKLCGGGASDEKALNFLRDLHDHTEAPILLCGTTDLVAYLDQRQARGREPMAQIRSRIGICRDLAERAGSSGDEGPGDPLFTVEEVRRIFAKSKMRLAADAARYLMLLANAADSGALRACRNLVIMATMVRQERSDVLTAADLRAAMKLVANRRAITLLDAKMGQMEPARPLMKVG